jgi:hypothetical protein
VKNVLGMSLALVLAGTSVMAQEAETPLTGAAGETTVEGGGLFAFAGLGGIGATLGIIAAVVTVVAVAADDDNSAVSTN